MDISGSRCQEAKTIIDSLFEKYENDEYMISKTHNYICNQLPNILENWKENQTKRLIRNEELSIEQDNFIQSFLNDHHYFYVTTTDKFFYYDGLHYKYTSEDDIIHHILSSITFDRSLMSWKQKTRISIMKRIKENLLIKCIPESDTIQFVLNLLYPSIFSTRNEAKYFLCVLGDNLTKTHTQNTLIHYIDSKAKHFIRELNHMSQFFIGTSQLHTFKFKYHDHSYEECRILKINSAVSNETTWHTIIQHYGLDLICIACHYSYRYGSSDKFISKAINDRRLTNRAFYLKNNSPSQIVDNFISEFFEINNTNTYDQTTLLDANVLDIDNLRTPHVNWKEILYLWKLYLETKDLPPIMFLQTLKKTMIEKLDKHYKEEHDIFLSVSSKHLPSINSFLNFWNETTIYDDNESEFEIEELTVLYHKWCGTNKTPVSNLSNNQIIDLISHFFPNIEIDRDKYISGVCNKLWDKQLDIQTALDAMRETLRNNHEERRQSMRSMSPSCINVSIYDTYNFYCKYHTHSGEPNSMKVSKVYFEKYIFDTISEYITDNRFLSAEWYII